MYLVYEAKIPDGSIYIGRTGQSLDARIVMHHQQAKRGSHSGLHAAMRRGETITWRILWSGHHYYRSMGMEISEILKAKRGKRRLLNRTRGGFYDKYDYLKLKRKAMGG